jgi:hypothetical protein
MRTKFSSAGDVDEILVFIGFNSLLIFPVSTSFTIILQCQNSTKKVKIAKKRHRVRTSVRTAKRIKRAFQQHQRPDRTATDDEYKWVSTRLVPHLNFNQHHVVGTNQNKQQ